MHAWRRAVPPPGCPSDVWKPAPSLPAAAGPGEATGAVALNRYPGARLCRDLVAGTGCPCRIPGGLDLLLGNGLTRSSRWLSIARGGAQIRCWRRSPASVMLHSGERRPARPALWACRCGTDPAGRSRHAGRHRRAPAGAAVPGLPEQPHRQPVGCGHRAPDRGGPGRLGVIDEAYQPFAGAVTWTAWRADPASMAADAHDEQVRPGWCAHRLPWSDAARRSGRSTRSARRTTSACSMPSARCSRWSTPTFAAQAARHPARAQARCCPPARRLPGVRSSAATPT